MISVCWCHPRYCYQDKIEDAAYQNVKASEPSSDFDLIFGRTTPQYKTVGKSRKKVVSSRSEGPSQQYTDWYYQLRAEEERLSCEGRFEVRLSLKTTWTPYSRLVEVVMPVEIRSHDELVAAAGIVRRLLRGETTLETEFPGYRYTFEDWKGNGLAKELNIHPMVAL